MCLLHYLLSFVFDLKRETARFFGNDSGRHNGTRWTCELATAPYAAQMPAPSLLSLPPSPGHHMLIVVFKYAFGPHLWAEMNAIVVNQTIAATRKICHFGTLFCFACPRSSTVQYLPRSLRTSVVILTSSTCTRSH